MKLRTDYFKINCVDMEKSLAEYIKEADENYVILYDGIPDMWAGNGMPVIYGDYTELMYELSNSNAFEKTNGELKDGYKVMTEQDFLFEFCRKEIEDAIAQMCKIFGDKMSDNQYVFSIMSDKFNGCIDKGGVTDVLNITYDDNNKELTAFISTPNDDLQYYVFLDELPNNVLIMIIEDLTKVSHS